ncbi:type I pullulanase [Cytobacillus solani]|uniref:Pullulanase n=1 Tax=Cytobacillus solani TaxID=1637975 RepID=A0A0Q3SML0_9BACI|nr:type I pullulanase [Cytobacillus solani]KOP83790.1 pullulanase [Bacillus sp. FJAT-21945]KQL20868.1 pullulanase [Cytobacillus solani]
MKAINRKFSAYLDDMQIITILLPKDYFGGSSSKFSIRKMNRNEYVLLTIMNRIPLEKSVKYTCQIEEKLVIGEQYWVIDEHGEKTDLQIGAVIRTAAFDKEFFYDGLLGSFYHSDHTLFKLWAPTATKVKLKLLPTDTSKSEIFHSMMRKEKGVWHVTVKGDLECYYYSFQVFVNLEWREAADPYATSVSLNGEYAAVIDLNKTKMTKPPLPLFKQPTDAIIYETHIRDLTIHSNSGIINKGTYLGAAELNTVAIDGTPTGLSYIQELGITHIEFLPINDFEGIDERKDTDEYNWGYNPLHFNAPDGSFSTAPSNPYARVKELKAMIHAVHTQGIRVIMDVVYNHVYIRECSSFENIVPGYYFRHDEFGMPSNGTGVGNDFASERLMGRKFIIDSVMFWLKEYEIDGFRFDLMGILDIETMNEIRKAVDSFDPSILIIGEGWDLDTPISADKKACIRNQESLPRIGQFNDWFRDTVKGSTFHLDDKGYAFGNVHYYEAAKQVLAGSIGMEKTEAGLFHSPVQSVNYVESHDNHTLWDKLAVCSASLSKGTRQKQHRLATVMVLLSQGIPFLHSGQEFFRTKKGEGNSYQSSDEINQLDWDRKSFFAANVIYLREIIRIRKSHGAFRFSNQKHIREHMCFLPAEEPVIGFFLNDVDEYGDWAKIIVFFNPSFSQKTVELPDGLWLVLADDQTANVKPKRKLEKNTLELPPICSYVLVSK